MKISKKQISVFLQSKRAKAQLLKSIAQADGPSIAKSQQTFMRGF
jgi:hypothetical protein